MERIFRDIFDIFSGVGYRALGHFLRRSARNHGSAAVSALRSDINNIVRRLDDIQIVFDDNDGISALGQAVQNLHQFVDIRKMKSRRRLVENVDRFPVPRRLSSAASLIRCASPPDSVVDGWPRRM